ncbi:YfhO family protein [Fructobacillus pseudoficulneus]|nr:YfhO family protein [Fructobacillus pseudoficulneus]
MKKLGKICKQTFISPIALSFWIPVIIMTAYFAGRHMAPFGSSTILTVDLGQQYLDYFVQFKHTLLSDPSSFIYSFSSGLGGDMVSEWSYYLMSPFNLIFLLASPKTIPVWILLVTVLKIGFAGFSMAWLIQKMGWLSNYWIPLFAINYPLSAWFIANDLNLLWLDTAAILPLLIWSLERLLAGKGWTLFATFLTATIITNYYIAWMIALFLCLYLPWRLLDTTIVVRRLQAIAQAAKAAAISVLLTMWLWLPTYVQLRLGKTTHNSSWSLHFDNNPIFLLLKLVPGSFDFDQMQTGQANFLVAPIIILSLWAYFAKRQTKIFEKIFALVIIAILFLATCFAPLTLLFHGGQYPVWYPARFSFIISFFFILLAAKGFTPDWQPGLIARTVFLLAVLALTVWASSQLLKVTYLDKLALLVFLFFYLATVLVLITFQMGPAKLILLTLTTAGFLTINVAKTLNHLSYLTNASYQAGSSRLLAASSAAKQNDRSWYRISQGMSRTYNDGFLAGFKAGSHFSSLLPAQSSSLFQNLGQVSGDSRIAYLDGTTVSDSLLAFKYYLQPTNALSGQSSYLRQSNRPDYDQAKIVASGNGWNLRQNSTALAPVYAASDKALQSPYSVRYPLGNQKYLLGSLVGNPSQDLLYQAPLQVGALDNLTISNRITGGTIQKVNKKQNGTVAFTFTPTTNDSYYLNIGGALDLNQVDIRLNGEKLTQSTAFQHTIDLNLLRNQANKEQILTVTLKNGANSRYLDDFTLYYFDEKAVNQDLAKLQQHPLKITQSNSRRISGTITTTADQSLIMTSIPAAPGWQAKLDGKVVTTKTVMKGFLAVQTKPGMHHLTLTYTPPFFLLGVIVSAFTATFALLRHFFNKNRTGVLRQR